MHCGLCLDACPTFRATGLETESPRGRIYLMTQWKRGQMTFDEKQVRHIDLCLGCRTCEAVCPSGVPYGRIIEAGRSEVERMRRPSAKRWIAKTALRQLVAHPRRLRAFGASHVLVTCGARGVCWCGATGTLWLPSAKVKVVDTVGAVDCFCGSFAAAVAESKSIEQAIRFAMAAAAICVTRPGAQPAMPRRSEIAV